MNGKNPPDLSDKNMAKLLRASTEEPNADFERRLIKSTLREVRRERKRLETGKSTRRWWRWAVAASATVAIALLLVWGVFHGPHKPAGVVRNLYGFVSVRNGTDPKPISQSADLQPGQWIETAAGSEAEILLEDRSRLLARPRTRLQIKQSNGTKTVRLEDGFLRIEAAKRDPGRSLSLETPGARIEIVGTKFDVHVVQRRDGRKQTRVSVAAGEVNLESGGKQVVLPANTEGIAEEGRAPVRRSLTPEVNEMIRLIQLNQRMAAESNLPAGVPTIIDFRADGTATVWTVATLKHPQSSRSSLRLEGIQNGVAAFSIEGAPLVTRLQGDALEVEIPHASTQTGPTGSVILSIASVSGIFQRAGEGAIGFERPPAASPLLSLFQFRLPGNAHIEEISPKPIEIREAFSRKVVTVAANCEEFPVPGLAETQPMGGI